MSFLTGMTIEDMKSLATKGAYVEHSVHAMMPLTYRQNPEQLLESVRAIGPEHCIISSDFGQDFHPMPAEGLRMGVATLLNVGLEEVEAGIMVRENPSRLLGL